MTYEYIRMTYEYIRVTYEWHTGTYEWHANGIRVTKDDIRIERQIKLTFYKLFDHCLSNIWLVKEFLACNDYFGLFTKIRKRPGISFWCTFSAWFFYTNAAYLILYQLTEFQCHIFFLSQDIKQNVLLSSYLDNWWCHKL